MTQRILEILFERKFYLLAPLVALALLGLWLGWNQGSNSYQSTARVWAQQSPFVSTQSFTANNPYLTPAQNQAQSLNDLLSLDSFATAVAAGVPKLNRLQPERQAAIVQSGVAVDPSGTNVISITYEGTDPALAQQVVQGVLSTYSDRVRDEVTSGATTAQSFYESRLTSAQDNIQKAQSELASYQPAAGTTIATDPQAASLRLKVQQAEDEYSGILDTLQQIELEKQAALAGRDVAFRVMDAPVLPVAAQTTSIQSMLMFPALSILLGLAMSGALLFAFARLDDSLRVAEDASLAGVPLLAVLPDLGAKRERAWPRNFVRMAIVYSRGISRGVQNSP